jgi:hypothetical protein
MTTRAILTELRNANTQTDIGREILDKLLEETKKPRTPPNFREINLDCPYRKPVAIGQG